MRVHSAKRRRLYSVMVATIFILSTMLAVSTSFLSDRPDKVVPETPADNPPTPVRTLALTNHDPIYIGGNDGFTNGSGVVWGSGKSSDPYVIEGWEIDYPQSCEISIQNADVHFIIRNCYIHDSGYGWIGIVVRNCRNGTLSNNICSSNWEGMWVDSSSNITICNNTFSSNSYIGMFLTSLGNSTISNNNCSSNPSEGMCLLASSNNTISNNTCWNNGDGIALSENANYLSSNNTICNNTCLNNGNGIYLHSPAANLPLNNAVCNNTCSNNSHGIDLTDASGNTIFNNACPNNSYGMYLCSSNWNILNNNTCSNNQYGIYLEFSSGYNIISCNLVYDSVYYGIYIVPQWWPGSNNMIWNNTFIRNNGAIDTYDVTHIQAYDEGLNNWWNSTDGYGNYWSDWTIPDANGDGIVDLPYNISGSAGAQDHYPLTTPQTPIPEFGMMPLVVMALLIMIVIVRRMGVME